MGVGCSPATKTMLTCVCRYFGGAPSAAREKPTPNHVVPTTSSHVICGYATSGNEVLTTSGHVTSGHVVPATSGR